MRTHPSTFIHPLIDAHFASLCKEILRAQSCFDIGFHRIRIIFRAESLDGLAFFVHQKLCEIPLDGVHQKAPLSLLEVIPEWMGVVAIHVDFLKKVKGDAVNFGGVFLDFSIGAGLLTPELIAGKPENPQTRISVLAIQSL